MLKKKSCLRLPWFNSPLENGILFRQLLTHRSHVDTRTHTHSHALTRTRTHSHALSHLHFVNSYLWWRTDIKTNGTVVTWHSTWEREEMREKCVYVCEREYIRVCVWKREYVWVNVYVCLCVKESMCVSVFIYVCVKERERMSVNACRCVFICL